MCVFGLDVSSFALWGHLQWGVRYDLICDLGWECASRRALCLQKPATESLGIPRPPGDIDSKPDPGDAECPCSYLQETPHWWTSSPVASLCQEADVSPVWPFTMCSTSRILVHFLKKYILLIMTLQLSQFLSFCPSSHSNPNSLWQSSTLSSCPWVIHVSSLAYPFPILFLTSPPPPAYSVLPILYYQFVLLNPYTFYPMFPRPPPNW